MAKNVLIVVDMQKDFVDGSLGIHLVDFPRRADEKTERPLCSGFRTLSGKNRDHKKPEGTGRVLS